MFHLPIFVQPTVGIKNALQEGRPVPRTISGLYRGLGVCAAMGRPRLSQQ
jgi:hypothetical protein